MKKVLLVFLVLFLVSGSVSVTMAEMTDPYIKIGDYGEEVIALHQKLADLGYYSLRPESPWSEKSADALKILQENLDWEVTGVVDSKGQVDEILAMQNVVGKNLLLGTNKETTNFKLIDKGFNATLESPDGISVKAISTSRDDSGWLVLFFDDGRSRELLAKPAGAYFTLSFEAKSNVENAEISASHRQENWRDNQIDFGSVRIEEPNVWQRCEMHGQLTGVAATSQGIYIGLGGNPAETEIEIKNLKLEKGTVATEWCTAE